MHAINGGGNAWIKIIGVSEQYASKRCQDKRWVLFQYVKSQKLFVYLKYQMISTKIDKICKNGNIWLKNIPILWGGKLTLKIVWKVGDQLLQQNFEIHHKYLTEKHVHDVCSDHSHYI